MKLLLQLFEKNVFASSGCVQLCFVVLTYHLLRVKYLLTMSSCPCAIKASSNTSSFQQIPCARLGACRYTSMDFLRSIARTEVQLLFERSMCLLCSSFIFSFLLAKCVVFVYLCLPTALSL